MKYVNHLFFFIFCLLNSTISQTVLTPGDIVVIGIKTNADTEAGNDGVKMVTLVDLQCGTSFIITDNNWNNNTNTWECDNDEFGIEIICNSPVPAGSIFYVKLAPMSTSVTCSIGSILRDELNSPWGTDYEISDDGDNIYLLQGTRAAPNFIFAIKHNGSFSNNSCSDKNQAGLPSNLTLGSSAIEMSSSKDQWHYNGITNSGNKATLTSAICNSGNWVSAAVAGQRWDNTSGFLKVTSAYMQYGVLAVIGSGCGCLSGCNLAYYGGVNCTGTTGDCIAGYQPMSQSITVPSGCRYIVYAEMKNRSYGCSSSGADGNCQTCDVLKVDVLGGTKLFQQGMSNDSLFDSYDLTGPGTIIVSGRANRADEIITYGIIPINCNCLLSILPIELLMFKASIVENTIKLNWITQSENTTSFFAIERSQNGATWETISIMESFENSNSSKNYSIFDTSPLKGTSYYRLKRVDKDDTYSYSQIETVDYKTDNKIDIYPNPTENGLLNLVFKNDGSFGEIKIIDSIGKILYLKKTQDLENALDLSPFEKGMYTISVTTNTMNFYTKVIYQ